VEDTLAAIRAAVLQRTATGLATALSGMISSGGLAPGSRLPTVRAVAAALHMSPTVVGEAWTALARSGIVRTEGRRGTFVGERPAEAGPPRGRSQIFEVGAYDLDLSTGVPDTRLLPDLRQALARLSARAEVSNYLEPTVLPALAGMLRSTWADVFDPEAITIVDGAMDGLDRVCREVVRFGDRVIVEDPALHSIFDLVESHGGQLVGVPLDDEGLVPSALEAALRRGAVLLVLQPRAQNPTGVSTSEARAAELARVLAGHGTIVVEDDHCGDVAWAPLVSLARWLPSRTVHLKSFSKSHGPDLRLAALAGPRPLTHAIAARRRLGPSWTSRLLQAVLLELLLDDACGGLVEDARRTYHERRQRLAGELAARGVTSRGADGINLWVDVADEVAAKGHLARRRVGVRQGSPFELARGGVDHLRVTCCAVASGHAELADLLAEAAQASRPRRPARGERGGPRRPHSPVGA
jgi:DNA-binding transcriptional MocR family regulator